MLNTPELGCTLEEFSYRVSPYIPDDLPVEHYHSKVVEDLILNVMSSDHLMSGLNLSVVPFALRVIFHNIYAGRLGNNLMTGLDISDFKVLWGLDTPKKNLIYSMEIDSIVDIKLTDISRAINTHSAKSKFKRSGYFAYMDYAAKPEDKTLVLGKYRTTAAYAVNKSKLKEGLTWRR